jgi:V-type H+-transporting ATPase subunit a
MNEFTWSFHEIVVTYGTPNYREVNPTLFNIVTFPFLFGIMFGDIGHGALLLMLAIYLCLRNERELSVILKPLAKIKYMLLLMGIFATYCGFIYNDMMSLPLNLFGSCYINRPGKAGLVEASLTKDCVYPFGLDPKWYVGHNELAYFNSYKMKLAVILGILQMSLGVTLKGLNAALAWSGLDFFCEFLP